MTQSSVNPMGSRPVVPLLFSMSVPPMFSMFIQSMYNIVDSIFVAQLGEEALAAVSLVFPLQNLVLAAAVGLGVAVNAVIAQYQGAGMFQRADEAAECCLILSAVHGLVFLFAGWLFSGPFIGLFTDNPQILKGGEEYSRIVVCLGFGSLFHIALEKMFQATGHMLVPMFIQAAGALTNIVLDPIMIFGWFGCPAMGIRGAALATVTGQFLSLGLSLLFFAEHCGGIRVNLRHPRFQKAMILKLYGIAVPSAIMSCLPSALVALLNGILAGFSQTAVAVLGIYFKLQMFATMPSNGIVQGFRPIVSYNYGAGKIDRMKTTLWATMAVIGVIMGMASLLFFLSPGPIMELFQADEAMKGLGETALKLVSWSFLFSVPGVVFSGAFEALGRGAESLTVSLLRQLIVPVLLSHLLAASAGVNGVWYSFSAAEILGSLTACVMFCRLLRKIAP